MIASLSGTVLQVGPTSAVSRSAASACSPSAARTPSRACGSASGPPLATSLVVREDSLTLYGFATADEREFFELLLTATGVGPKLAQAALAVLPPGPAAARRSPTENLVQLCKVPGIGRKGAQRMVIELKDKINAVGLSAEPHVEHARQAGLARPGRPGPRRASAGRSGTPTPPAARSSRWSPRTPTSSVAVLMRAALQALARR